MKTNKNASATRALKLINITKEISAAGEAYDTGNPAALLLVAPHLISVSDKSPRWVKDGLVRALALFASSNKFKGTKFKRRKAAGPDHRALRAWQIAGQQGKKGEARLEEAQKIIAERWKTTPALSSIENSIKKAKKAQKSALGRAQFIEATSALAPNVDRIKHFDGSIFD